MHANFQLILSIDSRVMTGTKFDFIHTYIHIYIHTMRNAVRDELLVRPLVPAVTIELRDLEETTTEEEIKEAFIAALVEVTPDQVEVKTLRAGPLVVAPRAIAL